MDSVGRKVSIMLASVLLIVGALTVALSTNFWVLLLGRSLQGMHVPACDAMLAVSGSCIISLTSIFACGFTLVHSVPLCSLFHSLCPHSLHQCSLPSLTFTSAFLSHPTPYLSLLHSPRHTALSASHFRSLQPAHSPLFSSTLLHCLQGLGSGCTITATSVYITELAPARHRGALVSLADIGINFGILLGCV
jgi:MFS family permease